MKRKWAWLPFAVALLVTRTAHAQFVSPGPLARAHANIDGISNCGKCHEGTAELPARLCLKCHAEIGDRAAAGKGFHGHLNPTELNDCRQCHSDHRGREFSMVDWGRGLEFFDHKKTGYPLKAKHAKVGCGNCHDRRRIQDQKITKMLTDQPRRASYLGVPTKCGPPCHFDEHRGELKLDCQKCHTEDGWKPATQFDHGKTDFPLRGKHQKVKCGDCHPSEKDEQTAKDAFPHPVAAAFMKMKPLDHESCETCHEDVHKGEFGPKCDSCHVETGWKVVKQGRGGKDAGFHDKTKFPLRGGHIGLDCRSCHGPFPGRPAVFKGLAFASCTDCHADAHLGQLAGQKSAPAAAPKQSPAPARPPLLPASRGSAACEPCHTVNRFFPALYELEQHGKTKFPLDGAHQAAACRGCHPVDGRLQARVAAPVRNELKREKRVELFSFVAMRPGKKLEQCASCHQDVHAGQFEADTCNRCHKAAAWVDLAFDHNKDSRFPLTGKHAEIACAGCHKSERVGAKGNAKTTIRYKPMALECASCHADYHLGQFRVEKKSKACEQCHGTKTFKETTFNHNDPKFTSYGLEGKHAKVKCERCHPVVKVASATKTARYRPLPQQCEDCHVDYHKGEFKGFVPGLVTAVASANQTSCAPCHSVKSWGDVKFDHDRTGFPLHGAHEAVKCKSCHPQNFVKRVADTCSGCHRDAHAGEFGLHCETCHQEKNWRTTFTADAHRRTNFPLTGGHALIPCEECHGKMRDRNFSRAPLDCLACHRQDVQRAAMRSIDHTAAGFSTDCRQCHDTWRFTPARFTAHDGCFNISSGSHRGIRCLSCHTSSMGFQVTGQCTTGTAACSSCHEHACAKSDAQHRNVMGYSCADQKCYQCHRTILPLQKRGPR